MDILQLEHFLAVVEEGTFTRAAEKVFRTQPAISQSIKKLEEEIGAPLFARDMLEPTLTEAGKLLVEYARRMLRLRDDTIHALGELRTLQSGSVSIAAAESAALYLLPGPLKSYLRKFPDIRLGIFRRPMEDIPRQVCDREIDVGFVIEPPIFREIQSMPIHSDQMILISSPRHPFARRSNVRISDLGQERFVIHHVCTSTTRKILQLFEKNGTPFRVAAELWGFESIKNFVQQDVGLAIIPGITVREELRSGSLVQIKVSELSIPRWTYMIYRDRRYLSESARELLNVVQRFDWRAWTLQERARPALVHS